MLIRAVSAGGRLGQQPARLTLGNEPAVRVALAVPVVASGAAQTGAKADEAPGQIVPLLTKGTALGTVYKGGSFLLSQVNETSSGQVAGVLQQYNLVKDAGMAQSQADQIVALMRSKGTNSVLIGAVAGTWMAVAVDLVRPKWPFWTKALIGAVTAISVASLLFFGLEDKAPQSPLQVPPNAAGN